VPIASAPLANAGKRPAESALRRLAFHDPRAPKRFPPMVHEAQQVEAPRVRVATTRCSARWSLKRHQPRLFRV
jgi:hypothetical protein